MVEGFLASPESTLLETCTVTISPRYSVNSDYSNHATFELNVSRAASSPSER